MTSPVRRAGAFAGVGTIALAVPLFEVAAAAPFAAIAAIAAFTIHDGPIFDLFARPGEHKEQRLYGLIGFTLAATGLVLLAGVSSMPLSVCVGTVVLVAYGNLGAQVGRRLSDEGIVRTTGFALFGGGAFAAGAMATRYLQSPLLDPAIPEIAFLAATGALLGALLRTFFYESDDAYVMLTVGIWLWLLSLLATEVTLNQVGIALAVSLVFGYLSYALETASIPGMLTGVTMSVVTIVLGGIEWFVVLIAFFGIGGLSTKFRYEEKLRRGVAEPNEGARGTANVLANGAVGLAAVLLFAASGVEQYPELPVENTIFLFAFVGSLATAMSDTLSSEIGGVFDNVRLITTLRRVEPGTDGGITWQGELAGVAGASIVAAVAFGLFESIGPAGAGVVVAAGVAGMTVDSLLGATVEGKLLGNGSVNFLATLAGALVAAAGATAVGLV